MYQFDHKSAFGIVFRSSHILFSLVFRKTYMDIWDANHREDETIVMELDEDAERLYQEKCKSIEKVLNDHWEKCTPYDSSLSKLHHIWLRVAAILTVLYNHISRRLRPELQLPIEKKISKANMEFAINLVKFYTDQKNILNKVIYGLLTFFHKCFVFAQIASIHQSIPKKSDDLYSNITLFL